LLHYYLVEEDIEMVKKIVNNGVYINQNMNIQGIHQGGVLHQTLYIKDKEKRLELLKFFLDNDAYINKTNDYGETALMIAIRQGQTDEFEHLLNNGADPHIQNIHGENIISTAMIVKENQLIKDLVEKGVDYNLFSTSTHRSPFMIAIESKNIPMVDYLLENNVLLHNKEENLINLMIHNLPEPEKYIDLLITEDLIKKNENLFLLEAIKRSPISTATKNLSKPTYGLNDI